MRPPEVCPVCGADVPSNAKSCPECGSDETTGWSEEAHASDLDLPEEDFNYNEFVDREFGNKKAVPRGIKPMWWIVAIVLVLILSGAVALLLRAR